LSVVMGGVMIAPILRALCDRLAPNNYFAWYTLSPCRADALLLGVAVAILTREPRWREVFAASRRAFVKHWVLWLLALVIGLAGLARWASHVQNNHIGFLMVSAVFSVIAVLYTVLLLNALLFPSGWLGACLRWRWLRSLGTVSYGVYLFHNYWIFLFFHRFQPIMHSARELASLAGVVACLSLCCVLSWRFVETPLLKLGRRWQYQTAADRHAGGPVLPLGTPGVQVKEIA
jgi:peptidoglycan/LPS O-acetylase OafA/YrhL